MDWYVFNKLALQSRPEMCKSFVQKEKRSKKDFKDLTISKLSCRLEYSHN
jgi:hypothetical protein